MISSHFGTMVATLLPADAAMPYTVQHMRRLPAPLARTLLARAERAARLPFAPATLDLWKSNPSAFAQNRVALRTGLTDLCLGEAVGQEGRYIGEIAQRVYALLCEPCWNGSGARSVTCVSRGPDNQCAQTAQLLTWTLLLHSKALLSYAPGLCEGVTAAIEHRFASYLLDPACCEAVLRTSTPLAFARAAAVVCLCLQGDNSTRWLRLKNALRIADRCMENDWLYAAWRSEGLSSWVREAAYLADIVLLCDIACGEHSGLRTDADLRKGMDLPAKLHIAQSFFADEKSGLCPSISAEALYRIGATFDRDALCATGAYLAKQSREKAPVSADEDCTSALLSALWHEALEAEPAPPASSGLVEERRIGYFGVRTRSPGFTLGMFGGSFLLFDGSTPVLPLSPVAKSLPEIEGLQANRSHVRDATVQQEGFPSISMDIAPSYPPQASLASWQRTFLLTGNATTLRLIDAFDFSGTRKTPSLCFVCAETPVLAVGANRARIGEVAIEWEGPHTARIEQRQSDSGQKCICLILTGAGPMAGGCWTTTFSRRGS